MLSAFAYTLRIGVAADAVSLVRLSRWRAARVTLLAQQAFAPSPEQPHEAIAEALRKLLAGQRLAGWPVSFMLADELTRLWQVTPPAGAARLADLEAAAALRFQALYGEAPGGWQISADWDAAAPFFAAALPRPLLAALQQVAQEARLPLVAITPHFVSAWNRWQGALKPGSWYGLAHDGLLTLALVAAASADGASLPAASRRGSQLRAVRAMALPADASPAWLTQTLQREALLHNLAAPALLQASGVLPAAWRGGAGLPTDIPCLALEPAGAGAADTPALVRLALGGSWR